MVSKAGKEFPVEMTASRPVGEADRRGSTICFMRDISESRRAAEAEAEARANAVRIEQLERELRSLEQLQGPPQTSVTAQMYGSGPLRGHAPNTFNQFVRRYGNLIDLALEQRGYRVEHSIPEKLRAMSEQLGFLKAGPRDVVEIHTKALKGRSKGANPGKTQAYAEEGRLMALELMGDLVSYYRRRSSGAKEVAPSAAPKAEDRS